MVEAVSRKNGDFLRKPPSSVEAEQAVLSAIITNNRALEKVCDFLKPEHFVEVMHQKIYDACLRLSEKGHVVDTITLKNFLEGNGTLDMAGGVEYLTQLASSSISIVNVVDYARLVYECAIKRNLIEIGTDIVNNAYGGSDNDDEEEMTADKQIESAEGQLYSLATSGEIQSGPEKLESTLVETIQIIEDAFRADSSISGISTGLKDLDKRIGGLHPSDLLVIAGRPGMGKTAFALNIAVNVANEVLNHRGPERLQGPVLFFSLEMSADQLASRVLSFEAEVNGNSMRNGDISEEQFNKLVEYQRALKDLPLFLDDTPGITVPMMRARARRLKRQHGHISLILVDYIQLIEGTGKNNEDRVRLVSAVTRGLKMLAKELDVPVIALSQLSRKVEDRDDKTPQLSDLRESGSIEQDADCVMFVYRKSYYLDKEVNRIVADKENGDMLPEYEKKLKEFNETKNMAEIIIAKQRHGPTGTVKTSFIGEYFKFGDFYDGSTGGN